MTENEKDGAVTEDNDGYDDGHDDGAAAADARRLFLDWEHSSGECSGARNSVQAAIPLPVRVKKCNF